MSRMTISRLASAFAVAGVLAACAEAPTTSSSPDSSQELAPQDAPAFSAGAAAQHIPGRFIITLRPGVNAAAVAREHGVQPDFVYSAALNGFAGSIADAARAGLLRDFRVERVEQDGIATTQEVVQSGATWGLDRIDQTARTLNGSFGYTATGAGVTAYILDTGIRPTHTEFTGRVRAGYSSISDKRGTTDCNGHGTHVAGTVGGTRYGVAKGVSLVPGARPRGDDDRRDDHRRCQDLVVELRLLRRLVRAGFRHHVGVVQQRRGDEHDQRHLDVHPAHRRRRGALPPGQPGRESRDRPDRALQRDHEGHRDELLDVEQPSAVYGLLICGGAGVRGCGRSQRPREANASRGRSLFAPPVRTD